MLTNREEGLSSTISRFIKMNQERIYSIMKYNLNKEGPKIISWDITNRCNLGCRHCFNNSGDNEKHDFSQELTDEECILVAKQISDLKPQQICICGGEPLLRSVIYDVIKILTDANICVNMVSNGLLMTKNIARRLRDIHINDIQISVDGLGSQHDIFRNREGAFKAAIQSIEYIKEAGINPVVSMVPNRNNYYTFPIFLDYMYKLGVRVVRMMPLLPIGRGKVNYNNLLLDSEETFDFVYQLEGLREKYKEMTIEWGDPLEHLHLIRLARRKYPVIVGIASDGRLYVTPYLPIYVGNIRKHSLNEYWHAGLNVIWRDKDINKIIHEINTVIDFEKKLMPFSFDLIEDKMK